MIALKIAQSELIAAWRERLYGFRILMLCLIFGIASIILRVTSSMLVVT